MTPIGASEPAFCEKGREWSPAKSSRWRTHTI